MQASSGGSFNSEINVTPLVDVVLVLLIIFMVIIPLSQLAYDIDIPRESTSMVPPDQAQKQVILGINATRCPIVESSLDAGLPSGCKVLINKEEVAVEDLPRRMGEIFTNRKRADRILFLAAEERLNYEGVIRILDLAKSGVEDLQMGIVTDERLALQ